MATIHAMSHAVDHCVQRSEVAVIVPTCNAGKSWASLARGLNLQGLNAGQVLIVDSRSEDGTADLARAEGYQVLEIEQNDFNHGGTRQRAVEFVPWASVVVYLTQDAILATPDAVDLLLNAFEDEQVAAAYGRQLPRPGAGPIEAHARLFNYPAESGTRDFESRMTIGIKATFLSNSFAAYRVSCLQVIGGFPSDVIMAEDAIVAGKLLLAGWKTAYVAEAQVYHSHGFSVAQEFRRYFDTGVYHRQARWLREQFGNAGGEGGKFVRSELSYLARRKPALLPMAILRTFSKALGYNLGLHGSWIGKGWSRRLSYHKSFWDEVASSVENPEDRHGQPKLHGQGHIRLR
jgi:rhamnosyltransferase